MPFRIRYSVNVEFLPGGIGPMGAVGNVAAPGPAPTGVGFTLELNNAQPAPTSPTMLAGDVTTLTNAMAADIAAQMNANLARIAAFATGGS